jgi:hypothetical protein
MPVMKLGTRDSGLGTRDSGLGTRDSEKQEQQRKGSQGKGSQACNPEFRGAALRRATR